MFEFLNFWVDAIWIPVAYISVHKKHRWWALGFVIASMILIRLQSEIMVYIGYGNGIMGFMTSDVHTRGIIVSSSYYILFIFMAHFSPKTEGVVFMAACLSLFFAIFVTAAFVMLL
ncbi:MAG: hypothetical protein COA45_10350 [Zetaproteobacteria bacterium]|nr:MAG: hypothetical protein COA45_10350 [Zetaproteobacteria bacterium]